MSFKHKLSRREISDVVDYIRTHFMQQQRPTTRYHTAQNGWPNHERYAAAFPYARGELSIDIPWEQLSASQRAGRQLFLATCLTCHEPRRAQPATPTLTPHAVSFPRHGYSPFNTPSPKTDVDALSSATPYSKHDRPPQIANLTAQEKRGAQLFQANCAFCHAADGSGKNWIGTFLQPHPRDLTQPTFIHNVTPAQLVQTIRMGLPGTSMPAWKEVLTDVEINAIAAYITRAFRPPHPPDARAPSTPHPK